MSGYAARLRAYQDNDAERAAFVGGPVNELDVTLYQIRWTINGALAKDNSEIVHTRRGVPMWSRELARALITPGERGLPHGVLASDLPDLELARAVKDVCDLLVSNLVDPINRIDADRHPELKLLDSLILFMDDFYKGYYTFFVPPAKLLECETILPVHYDETSCKLTVVEPKRPIPKRGVYYGTTGGTLTDVDGNRWRYEPAQERTTLGKLGRAIDIRPALATAWPEWCIN